MGQCHFCTFWDPKIDFLKHGVTGHVLVGPLEFSIDFNGSPKARNGQISTSTNDLGLILDAMDAESQQLSYGAMSFLVPKIDFLKHGLNGHVLVGPLEFSIDFNGSPKTRNGQISTSENDLDLILDAKDADSQGLSYGAMSFLVILGPKKRHSKT